MVKHNVLTPLRGRSNPYLPIVASPGAYTMDLMEVSSYIIDNYNNPLYAQTNAINANAQAGGYKYILVLIETTSRKLFAYPLKNKSSDTVEETFKNFLEDCHYRIQYLTMDSGGEYAGIKRYLEENEEMLYVTTHVVIAAEGQHTVLSRVDRVIRTIREMLFNYFAQYNDFHWHKILPQLVNTYNNTKHSSLWLYKGRRERVFFTPNQVYNSSRLMKLISLKDAAMRKNGTRYWKRNMKRGHEYHYMVNTGAFSKGSKRGMLSNDKVKIKGRIGNSFIVESNNPNLNNKVIPFRNLVKVRENPKPSGLLSALFSQIDKMIDLDKIETDKPKKIKHLSPKAAREAKILEAEKNYIEGRTRSQSKKK